MRHRLHGAVQVVGISDVGQVRPHNEDYVSWEEDMGLIVLADGMGGAKAGEVASELAVKTMMDDVKPRLADVKTDLTEVDEAEGYTEASKIIGAALNMANKTVFQVAKSQPQYSGMGTTVVGVIFYDNAMSIAYVGDSRLYRLRKGNLAQITDDHTMVNELVRRGFYTLEQARTAVNKNVLTRAVGVGDEVEIDVLEEATSVDDIYLFCSDGLSDMVDDEQIAKILGDGSGDLNELNAALVAAANENGGKDNVSVILAKVIKPYPAKRGWRQRLVDWIF